MEIKNRNEKRYIMALYYKQHPQQDSSMAAMYKFWRQKWSEDYSTDEPDAQFERDYNWILKTICMKKLEQIVAERKNASSKKRQRVNDKLQDFAKSKGFLVKKGNCVSHPYELTGYAVFLLDGKKLVYGKNFDLSYGEVVGYIERQVEKKEKSHGKI